MLDALPLALTDLVADVPGGPAINGAATDAREVLCHVGRDIDVMAVGGHMPQEARQCRGRAALAVEQRVRIGLRLVGIVAAPLAAPGRPSIAPEKLVRAMLLQVLYSVRSERQLVEQINYNLLFRWFVGLSIEAPCGTTRSSPRTATG